MIQGVQLIKNKVGQAGNLYISRQIDNTHFDNSGKNDIFVFIYILVFKDERMINIF